MAEARIPAGEGIRITSPRTNRSAGKAMLVLAAFLLLSLRPLAAQQITRAAVIDMNRVLAAFPSDTAALKNFETRKAQVQAEVDGKAAEIRKLQAKKAEAEVLDDRVQMEFLSSELARKTADLKEFISSRQNELDLLAKALSSNASFIQKLSSTIAQVAETEGYSLVLNLKPQDQNASIVLWNSASIDITDKVIQALSAGR